MVSRRIRLQLWWRRAGIGLRLAVFLLLSLLFALLVYWQRPEHEEAYQGSNLFVFVLVNLNIAILCVLIFLVARNVVKLIFDRRRKIFGSRLRMRLVVALVGLTLVPTSILFVLASGLLNRAMEGWFSNQVESAHREAVRVARYHYGFLEESVRNNSEQIALELQARQLTLTSPAAVRAFLEEERRRNKLFRIQVVDTEGEPVVTVQNAAAFVQEFEDPPPDPEAVSAALAGEVRVLPEEHGAGQFIRAYRPLPLQNQAYVLLVTSRIHPELTHSLAVVNDSFQEYQQLKMFKHQLRSGYLLMLAMLTALILFSAIWFGFYIAREISVPIQRLAEGTRAVARGDYDFQIRQSGDDEIGVLVRSFNTMTRDLRDSRREAEARRLLIETVLAFLSPGVVVLDNGRRVSLANASAVRLLGLETGDEVGGKALSELLPPGAADDLLSLIDRLESDVHAKEALETELSFISQGRECKVLCTAGLIREADEQKARGLVLLFDDITELSKAQQMAAWREAARRIAHEIKNPLTPIQLSAQRLQRFFNERNEFPEIRATAGIIVQHVDSIKRLANEFSNFAMMPTAEFELSNLNLLISDTVSPFAEAHGEIVFQFIADNKLPGVMIDREQVRRIVINLLQNSIAAIESERDNGNTAKGRIVLRTWHDRKRKLVGFEVADNGPGVPDEYKTRIFQPYFTTRKEGSGLGLAIVATIVSDHGGEIRIYDNTPKGAKFLVELPVVVRSMTQRRVQSA